MTDFEALTKRVQELEAAAAANFEQRIRLLTSVNLVAAVMNYLLGHVGHQQALAAAPNENIKREIAKVVGQAEEAGTILMEIAKSMEEEAKRFLRAPDEPTSITDE